MLAIGNPFGLDRTMTVGIINRKTVFTCGWERIVSSDGLLIGIDHFGASAPGEVLAEKFGLTAKAVAEKILAWL